jgi:acyl transferase domain-containing protein
MKQAALFVNECALAELWIDWGIKPQVLYGLDWLGECLAAYVGGVISLEDALKAVIVGKFAAVDGIKLNAPQIQIVSGINKAWLSENEATDLSYWDRSRDNEASEGLSGLTPDNRFVLLQIGERQKFNSDNDVAKTDQPLYSSFDGSGSSIDASDISRESFLLLKTLGQLWLEGVQIDWKSFHKREIRQRISLPAYPFQRERYWIEPLVPMATKETAASPGDTVNEQTSMTYHQRQDLSTEYVAPRSETERKLVAIWEDMIGTKPIGIEDDFFELGGHSLLATEIIFKVREHFNIDVPLDSLFEKPTIANISAYIETYLLTISQQESASSVDNREEGEL